MVDKPLMVKVRAVLQPFCVRSRKDNSRTKRRDDAKWAVELDNPRQMLLFT